MKKSDLFIALLIVTIWGANFTVIKLGLGDIPPMLLAGLRYLFATFPAIFFIKRPQVSWKYLALYALTVGIGQFSCLFYAIKIGMPAGIASIILQAQPFFTVIFYALLFKERILRVQILGFCCAFIGLYLIGADISGTPIDSSAFILTILAACFWSISNLVVHFSCLAATKNQQKVDMLGLVVWSSLLLPVPFSLLALIFNTPADLLSVLTNLSRSSFYTVLYLALGATVFACGLWNMLLGKYSPSKIAPLSLLVPVTGLITANLVLDEQLSLVQAIGGLIIILALLILNFNSFSGPNTPKFLLKFINTK